MSYGLVLGRRPLGAVLHSSNEPGELLQWLCHDDSTINIVLDVVIIILSNCNLLLIYLPQKDERLSQPGWLTYSGWFTCQLQVERMDRESLPVKDQRSSIVPRNQPACSIHLFSAHLVGLI